jgi:hypothetical protein
MLNPQASHVNSDTKNTKKSPSTDKKHKKKNFQTRKTCAVNVKTQETKTNKIARRRREFKF